MIVSQLNTYLLRHLQAAISTLGQLWPQPLASLMTITTIAIALSLPASLAVLLYNMQSVTEHWQQTQQVTLFLKQDLDQPQSVLTLLEEPLIVDHAHYQSSAQSFTEFSEQSGLGQLLSHLPSNPLPAVITLSIHRDSTPTQISELMQFLKTQPYIAETQVDMAWVKRLYQFNRIIEKTVLILSFALSLGVILVIGNTTRLTILHRQKEIQVMKLVGATNDFVRRPFLYIGWWYGLLGGVFSWLLLLIATTILSSPVNAFIAEYSQTAQMTWLLSPLLLILIISGGSLGILGAWLAVGRHLNEIKPA